MTEILAVIEDPGEKGIPSDLLGDRRRYRAHPGDLADLALAHVLPPPLGHLVAHQHHQLGTPARPLASTGQQPGIGIGKVLLETIPHRGS